MRREKILWLYCGLGVPEGVAGVRHDDGQPQVKHRLLLIGDELAEQIALPLRRLVQSAGATLTVEALSDDIPAAVEKHQATAVIFAAKEPPPIPAMVGVPCVVAPWGDQTAMGLAEHAARLWSVLS